MAYAFGFPRDVTKLIDSLWDWRYRLVRGGGKTPSASAMPLPVPPHCEHEPIIQNMKRGKYYLQRIEFSILYAESTMINILQTAVRGWYCHLIKRFDCCTSDDVRPCDLTALWNTCDACEPDEPAELQIERTHF